MNKLKLRGMNALFNLRVSVSVGESLLTGVATATAVHLAALPTPPELQVLRNLEVGPPYAMPYDSA